MNVVKSLERDDGTVWTTLSLIKIVEKKITKDLKVDSKVSSFLKGIRE